MVPFCHHNASPADRVLVAPPVKSNGRWSTNHLSCCATPAAVWMGAAPISQPAKFVTGRRGSFAAKQIGLGVMGIFCHPKRYRRAALLPQTLR